MQRSWPDPLISAEQLEAETAVLTQELCAHLSARGLGARRLCLSLYRADGSVAEVRAGLSAPSWVPEHMTALLGEKLAAIDAGFGVDVMVLAAVQAEKPGAQQGALAPRLQGGVRSDATQLVDRLANRLGPQRVRRIEPRASHIPERAEAHVTALAPAQDLAWPLPSGPVRPPLLLQRPSRSASSPRCRKGRRQASCGAGSSGASSRRKARSASRRNGGTRSPRRRAARAITTASRTRAAPATGCIREGLYGRDEELPRWFLHGLFG